MSEIIQRIAAELKTAYKAKDLIVLSYPTSEEFHAAFNPLKKPEWRGSSEGMIIAMAFLDPYTSLDAKPYILVCEESFPSHLYRDELTHEFSNYEVWKQRGTQMYRYKTRLQDHSRELLDDFEVRVARAVSHDEIIQLRTGSHPANVMVTNFNTYFFALYDGPMSVPTDYVTIKKGYNDRLIARKSRKLDGWLKEFQRYDTIINQIWLAGNFPYVAYTSFHPTNPKVERQLDGQVQDLAKAVGYTHLLSPIRRMRQILHDIRIPARDDNLFNAFLNMERVYFVLMSERGAQGTKLYWEYLRQSADAVSRFQSDQPK